MVTISVIVPTIGRDSLISCLNSLKNQTFDDFEIVVVGTNKKSKTIAEMFSHVRFVFSPIWNNAYQKNLGVNCSRGDIVAFIDDDAVAEPNWLEELVKHFKKKQVACVGGRIKIKPQGPLPTFLRKIHPNMARGFLGGSLLHYEKSVELKEAMLWGSNISFKKTVLKKLGGFDLRLEGQSITWSLKKKGKSK
ncbi:MAG: glycosyltransferase family 2 protein [Candidatus Aenigmarchaeota archaeon]|nr:glycosyltransferase family 2 protein [Candidatus Aenigmarchaeota archaeon]